ncbi:PH domain-containing protein [Candidatus Gracilibacteria bacterium]|nr:PH domain-containing protein [Candidatus Gracilibacteria bacterium]
MTQIVCPKCKKVYKFSEENLGKKVKCSQCEEVFIAEKSEIDNRDKNILQEEQNEEQIENNCNDFELNSSIGNKTKGQENKAEKGEDIAIKPHKMSFILLGSPVLFFLILLIISLIGGIFFPPVFVFSAVFFVILIITYILVHIAYKKESYTLTDRKIIHHYGNIISDNSVEINLDKITQVKSILGFIQYKIFGTGNLIIKTAGASSSKLIFKNIGNTMEVYEELQVRMRKNGFHLQKDKLVQEAKPHWLGVVGEVFGKIIGMLFFGFYLIIPALSASENIQFGGVIATIIGILFLVVIVSIFIVSYMDLKRRKYDVFTDSVFYTEGFLTKNFSFLPMEKVSDTENNQSFWSKIFGLHDVIISSEGSNNRVIFKNMTEGEQLMKNIKYLKNNITLSKSQVIEGEEEKSKESLIGYVDNTEEEILDYNKDFTANYKMNFLKTFSVSLFYFFIGFIIILFTGFEGGYVFILFAFSFGGGLIIKYLFTTFIVDNSTIESKFSFFSNRHYSFSVDKITQVTVKESILDMIFKTCSIKFSSIGSSSSIVFLNIKKTPELEKNILSKVGINTQNDSKNIPVNFSLINFLKANIGIIIFVCTMGLFLGVSFISYEYYLSGNGNNIVIIVGILIMLFIFIFILLFVYKKIAYSQKFYSQKLYENFIYSRSGIFFRNKNFVLKKNIKGITSTKYPLTSVGKLKINVSGEQKVQTGKNQQQYSIVSNAVCMEYITDVFEKQKLLDMILKGQKLNQTVIKSTKQSVGNSIVGLCIIFGIILVVGFLVEPIAIIVPTIIFVLILGLIIWSIKVKYYSLEKDRIIYASGIIYKSRQSILYKRFNFVSKNQGFLGKIFKNGDVNIYTLGSGSVDMKIKDSEDFREIYDILKKD